MTTKNTTEIGFLQAQSDNLPVIDAIMMGAFFGNNPNFVSAEIRGSKAGRSISGCYGDEGVGWVQVKREGSVCTVKAKMTPEHRVRNKPYTVILICNEIEGIINSVECEDCTASAGGCKHSVAFLAWLHRRSHDPSPTTVACYWRKSKLAAVGTTLKFIKAKKIGTSQIEALKPSDGKFLSAALSHFQEADVTNQIGKYYIEPSAEMQLSIHRLILQFVDLKVNKTAKDFLDFCTKKMSTNICTEVEKITRNQYTCALWFELRYGRITASKAYEASHCKTMDGTLVESILGARKLKDNAAMKRGRDLEPEVISILQHNQRITLRKCGLILDPNFPILGATPDAISDDFIVEVKCPTTEKTMKTYITSDHKVAARYMPQVQLQMFIAKRKHAIFCVADWNFETNKKITQIHVDLDDAFCKDLVEKCTSFWIDAIFPFISK